MVAVLAPDTSPVTSSVTRAFTNEAPLTFSSNRLLVRPDASTLDPPVASRVVLATEPATVTVLDPEAENVAATAVAGASVARGAKVTPRATEGAGPVVPVSTAPNPSAARASSSRPRWPSA